MNKKIALPIFFVLILILSISAIQAEDVNSTVVGFEDADSILVDDINQSATLKADDSSFDEPAKNHTELTATSSSIYYHGDYKVVLTDSNASSVLANKQVNFVINNVNYFATTDSNGVASVNLKLSPGKYNVVAFFEGDDEYLSSNDPTSSFSILPTIKATDITKYYKGTTQYTATFYDSQGHALANRNVVITVNGKSYTKKTNSKGVASVAVNLNPGSYKIVSTDPITGYKLTTTFIILSTISSSNLNKVAGDSRKFTVKFFKSNGSPLAKKYVKIKFKGKTKKYKTNSQGKVTLNVKKLKKGTYKVVCYNNGLSKTYSIKVFKRKVSTKLTTSTYTFYANQTKQIKVKLSTGLADYSNVGKSVKINIAGKTYSIKTDGSGMGYLKLPSLNKGLYKVQYTYAGNYYFNKATSTNYLTILDSKSTTVTPKGTTHFGYGAGTSLKVLYSAGGVPLIKKSVTLSVGGETYGVTTDNSGYAYIPINLNVGEYTVDYRTDGDSMVYGASGSFDIDVFKRSASKVTWKSGTSFKDNLQTFKVLVTDLNGKAVSSGTASLTIDGETYYATVSSSGYATFKTSVALGGYKVSFKFYGNNDLLPSQSSKSVKVTLSMFKNGINQKNTLSHLKAYLKSSSHCQVGNAKIKKLVKSLTKGLKTKEDKAKAIFNYVRDTLGYSYYYNTHHGAAGTLKYKSGNCVDHSHLLVAMFRTAGLHARYVHGVCKFGSGDTTGHVWTQVLIGKHWVCADATSYRNSLGKIANWNTKSYKIHAKYASLPF